MIAFGRIPGFICCNFPAHDLNFHGREGDEIKSKQASKRDRTLWFPIELYTVSKFRTVRQLCARLIPHNVLLTQCFHKPKAHAHRQVTISFKTAKTAEYQQLSRSAHRTPNFTNPEFQFPQFKVLHRGFFFLI